MLDHLKSLGTHVPYDKYESPSVDMLEVFDNPRPGRNYLTTFVFNEFSSLCLHGDTLIDVATDEEVYPEGVPIKDLVGKEGVVFSFDHTKGKAVARSFHSVRKTRKNVPLVCVTYDLIKGLSNAREIIEKQIYCTPEHPFLVRVGWGKYEWIEAEKLKPGMQLVSDQRSQDLIRGIPRHRLILENELERELSDVEIAHHVDHKHFNNTPENIVVVGSASEHFSLHQTARYAIDLDVQKLVDEYNSGENFHSLAKKYGVDTSTIYSRIEHLVEKRTQSESLRITNNSEELDRVKKECRKLYEEGYTTYELSAYYDRHTATISSWIRDAGGNMRTSLETKMFREEIELPLLNHRVISVSPSENADVYNMEVEDTECFFANGIVVHNCPKTGQPDFGIIRIEYIADKHCIETKSLKIYLGAYRMQGAFMEAVTNQILDDLVEACDPIVMAVRADFNTRGGTDISVMAEYTREG